MSKVITFATQFPINLSNGGKPTHFPEKIWGGLIKLDKWPMTYTREYVRFHEIDKTQFDCPKFHTIRSGHGRIIGQKFQPRVWSGRPYKSIQLSLYSDLEITGIWNYEVKRKGHDLVFSITGREIAVFRFHDKQWVGKENLELIATNDGLSFNNFMAWFKFPSDFRGQIICWNPNINYNTMGI